MDAPERATERLGDRKSRHALSALLVLAFLLRIWGLTYGLPFVEEFTSDAESFVPDALRLTLADPSPHWFQHPGSTVIYPLAILFHVPNRLARTVGLVDSYSTESFERDPTPYYAAGRLVAAVEGTFAVLVTYLIGKEIGHRRLGLVAGGLLAVSPLHVYVCHLARTDSPVVLFTSLSLLCCMKIVRERAWRYYIAAGASAGLAVSTKYYGLLVVACLPLAHLLGAFRERGEGERRNEAQGLLQLLLGVAFVVIAFAATSPFAIVEYRTTWEGILGEARTTHLSADGLSPLGNLWWYATRGAPVAMGWAAVAMVPVGLWRTVRRKTLSVAVLGAFVVVYVGGISALALHWDRWLLPAVPALAVVSALGVEQLLEWLGRVVRPGSIRSLCGALLLALVAWQPASETIVGNINRSLPDTRILAREWIQTNLPAGSAVATDAYSAPLDADRFRLMKTFSLSYEPLEFYREQGIEYLVTSGRMRERFAAESDRYESNLEFYGRLERQGALIYQIAPIPWQRTGPLVSVYQVAGDRA
ncbi:MAG TPA: glycosyltransferase family 39 protein [Anaerolineae bacterium]|nr:glycosyltransferase family 39 protein [Anaerolineae bacterium]